MVLNPFKFDTNTNPTQPDPFSNFSIYLHIISLLIFEVQWIEMRALNQIILRVILLLRDKCDEFWLTLWNIFVFLYFK